MSDARRNLPSASNAEADELCPGRFVAQQGLPEEKSHDAESGTRVHQAFQGMDVELSTFERDTVESGMEIENRLLTKWISQFVCSVPNAVREKRLWSHDPETLEATNSGQADAFWIVENKCLLEDLKSLFGDVPEAPRNKQLRDLAVLIFENYDVEEVTAFINQPRVTREPELVVYNVEDLKRAQAEMRARVKRSMTPNQPRIPGDVQCKHCRAKAVCPEANSVVVSLADKQGLRWDLVNPEDKIKLYDACRAAEKIIDSIDRKLKEDLKFNPDAVPGLKLEDGDKKRTLVDDKTINDVFRAVAFDVCPTCQNNELTRAACSQCVGKGVVQSISSEDFMGACSVKISECEALFRKTKGLKTKDAAIEFNKRCEGIIEKKPTAPSLKRVKS